MKKIYFYPNMPVSNHIMYKIISGSDKLSFATSKEDADITYFWSGETKIKNNSSDRLSLNGTCTDKSKSFVSAVYEKVFATQLMVDPTKYTGLVVEKSDENAAHDGRVLNCPISNFQIDSLCVYQIAIDSSIDDGSKIEEFRVPIVGGGIPFVYKKTRSMENRFSNINLSTDIVELSDVFSLDEVAKIVQFTSMIGMDVGEVDILRSNVDNQIYIIDANRTPNGPPNGLSPEKNISAIHRLAQCFLEFINSRPHILAKKIDVEVRPNTLVGVQNNDRYKPVEDDVQAIEFVPANASGKFFAYKIADSFKNNKVGLLAYWLWNGNAIFTLTKRQSRKLMEYERYIINRGSSNLSFDKVQSIFYENLLTASGDKMFHGGWKELFDDWHFVRKDSFGHITLDSSAEVETLGYELQYVESPHLPNEEFLDYQLFFIGDKIVCALLRENILNSSKMQVRLEEIKNLNFGIDTGFMKRLDLDVFSCVVQVGLNSNRVILKSYSATFMWPPMGVNNDLLDSIERKLFEAFRENVMPKIYQANGIWLDF